MEVIDGTYVRNPKYLDGVWWNNLCNELGIDPSCPLPGKKLDKAIIALYFPDGNRRTAMLKHYILVPDMPVKDLSEWK